ncbi:hypothetical protein R3P38DRAFT_2869854 [Favolaschia claudopus]|uniref:C2H2-type domain-containing protein n=1 Tax=Favolaschia claudopus TaxID=2862362 RepID=A0AAW0DC94_9AGAR
MRLKELIEAIYNKAGSFSTVGSRRPSLAVLYNNLKAHTNPYEELENAAYLFPIEDDEPKTAIKKSYAAPAVASSYYSSTPYPPFAQSDANDSDSDSDSSSDASDSDVEPMDMDDATIDANEADPVVIFTDTPFMPPREVSPEITQLPEASHAPKAAKVSAKAPARRNAPSPKSRSRKRVRSPIADEESECDADSESVAGDASDDDEYVPLPSLNTRKRTRTRSVSPALYCRSSASPPASSISGDSDRPTKRPRLPPPSRNVQASISQIQENEEDSDDVNNFVCRVCGWVQKNQRLPDFKRHVKTHQRTFDDDAQKGWRCKGVLRSEASEWGIADDAPSYDFLGKERVGGCLKTFSRRDALKRHLDNSNVTCVGRPNAPNED